MKTSSNAACFHPFLLSAHFFLSLLSPLMYNRPLAEVENHYFDVFIQAYHNSDTQGVPGKERKMPDHTFVPFLIRCCFPKG